MLSLHLRKRFVRLCHTKWFLFKSLFLFYMCLLLLLLFFSFIWKGPIFSNGCALPGPAAEAALIPATLRVGLINERACRKYISDQETSTSAVHVQVHRCEHLWVIYERVSNLCVSERARSKSRRRRRERKREKTSFSFKWTCPVKASLLWPKKWREGKNRLRVQRLHFDKGGQQKQGKNHTDLFDVHLRIRVIITWSAVFA